MNDCSACWVSDCRPWWWGKRGRETVLLGLGKWSGYQALIWRSYEEWCSPVVSRDWGIRGRGSELGLCWWIKFVKKKSGFLIHTFPSPFCCSCGSFHASNVVMFLAPSPHKPPWHCPAVAFPNVMQRTKTERLSMTTVHYCCERWNEEATHTTSTVKCMYSVYSTIKLNYIL